MEFGIRVERDVGLVLNAWVSRGGRGHGPARGGDVDIREEHLLVFFVGLCVECLTDLIGCLSKVEEFADE